MRNLIFVFGLVCLMSFGQAEAIQARTGSAPTGGTGSTLGYSCTNNEGQTASCSCVGFDDCMALHDSGMCETKTLPEDGTSVPDMTCTPGFRNCSCDWSQLEGDEFGWQMEVYAPAVNMAPAAAGPAQAEPRGNEVVSARRGSPRTAARITDGTSNTFSSAETDIVAPNNITAPNNRGTRLSPEATETLRQEALAAQRNGADSRRNEVVRARRGRFAAPSDLQIGEIQSTSLSFFWMDNTAFEHGVAVERGMPTVERGGLNYNWQHVFNVEEQVSEQADDTGWRSYTDDRLAPGTAYCYRLRAYRSDVFSEYSNPVCEQTAQ